MIFADNVTFQLEKQFHDACRRELNANNYLLPENHTDKIQPIDAGCGKFFKTKMGEEMDKWLESEDNLELWHDKCKREEDPHDIVGRYCLEELVKTRLPEGLLIILLPFLICF